MINQYCLGKPFIQLPEVDIGLTTYVPMRASVPLYASCTSACTITTDLNISVQEDAF